MLLIGLGSIGMRHAGILRGGWPEARIEAVTRREDTGLRAYPDLESAGDLGRFDYFVVASETHRHHGQLLHLLQRVAGKTILVEKPLFEAPRPVDPGSNRVLVAYNLRFHPVIQALREELRGERVSYANAMVGQYLPTWRPGTDYRRAYSASRAKGGGVLLDLSHEIDYSGWLFGRLEPAAGFAGKVSDLEIDSDDLAVAICRTPGGAVVSLSMDYLSRIPVRRILVHTARKTLAADLVANTLEIAAEGPATRREFPGMERNQAYLAMHRAAIEEGGGDCCTLQEGLETLSVADRLGKTGG